MIFANWQNASPSSKASLFSRWMIIRKSANCSQTFGWNGSNSITRPNGERVPDLVSYSFSTSIRLPVRLHNFQFLPLSSLSIMNSFAEKLIAILWNRLIAPRPPTPPKGNLDFGAAVVDDQVVARRVGIPQAKRSEHVAVLGKTGQGKSRFLRYLALQDIRANRGFTFFDHHGEDTPFLLRVIAGEE